MHSENIVATARLGRLPTINTIARREASIRRFSHCNISPNPITPNFITSEQSILFVLLSTITL